LPPGVLNFLTGGGATVGDAIVRHPRTRFVSFTGSKQVGIGINKLAAEVQPGQIWLKRVVAEMGGKDAIIVDDEADVDAAVEGVAMAAFGFSGQKCSACSRAIVTRPVYDEFVAKRKERVAQLSVGDADQYGVHMGPLSSKRERRTGLDDSDKGNAADRVPHD